MARSMLEAPSTSEQVSDSSTADMEIRVLGPVDVRVRGESLPLGGPKQRALLGLLIASAPHPVTAENLIEGIWGERVSAGSRSTLQTYVSNLRHVLGDALQYDRGAYQLTVDPKSIDAVDFTTALEQARIRSTTDPEDVATNLRRVLGMWRGRPYADLMDVLGLEAEIRRLEMLRLEAVELRIEAELASGRYSELLAELEALAEEHPTRERFRAQHMLALYRSGRQADALRAYRRTETYLAEELGVEPSEELQDLELKVLQHDESLLSGISRPITQKLAFLVTDIEGSTKLWDRFPQEMATALADHDLIVSEEVQRAGGRVFKHTGDGVLAAFPDAVSAVGASESILSRLSHTDWGKIGELRVRIGIDVGDAESRGSDYFGPPLNRAARLCAIAHGGQVVVSATTEREITASAPAGLQIRHLGEVHLRGMATPERVAQLVFVGQPADFPELRTDAGSALDERVETMSIPGYEIRERVGEGAFGVVWRAYQPSVGREVAVKVIRPELASQPSFVRGFEAEARTIARLAHPHIVPLIDFWRDETRAYLVLGLLPGGSLEMAARREEIDTPAARLILTQVGSALDHAHSQGISHGDLKPANVLLDGSGNAYLSDFGIATRLLDSQTVSYSSAPEYRAPEEITSGPSPAADRFALGMLARTLLGDEPELDSVLARATAPNPSDRYQSASEFIAALELAMGADPVELERPAVTRNPYKGLRPFDEADAADFFGREDLTATLVAAVSQHRFVTVVGPSGSGKSSVVRSGLLPAVDSDAIEGSGNWLPIIFAPGDDPLDALTQEIHKVTGWPLADGDQIRESIEAWMDQLTPEGTVLFVIDQFEELYTQVDDPDLRDEFVSLLVDAIETRAVIRIVATLRADFYDRPLGDPSLATLVRDGQITILPPSREELIDMIASPAQAVGLRFEPGLPHRIAEDVAHQPGGLPLLQYAMTELVERRAGDLLTGSDYSRIGEVAGALAKRAEALYLEMAPSQQEAVRSLLLRLVTVDEESDDTRRRVRRSELESLGIPLGDLNAVLHTFTAERLLLADRDPVARTPTVEVAHEALLREWPRLRSWIEDQRESLILGRRFRAALTDWEANGGHEDYLLTGTRLAPFVSWEESSSLTADEDAFYRASRQKDDEQRAARRRRRRTLTSILAVSAAIAVVLGTIALVAAGRAEDEAQRARANELAAFATAALEFDPTLAKLLAVSSVQIADPSVDTGSVLHQAFAADPVVERYRWPEDRELGFLWTALSPDGSRLVAAGCGCDVPSTYLEVFDLERDEVLWSFDEVEDNSIIVDSPIFSPDGQLVVAGLYWLGETEAEAGPLGAHIFEADTGELLEHFDLGRCGGTVYALNETHLLVDGIDTEEGPCFHRGMAAPTLSLIDISTGEPRLLTESGVFGAMSGNGRYVAYTDRSVEPWLTVVENAPSGERVLATEVADRFERVMALSDDGSLLVVSIEDRLEVRAVTTGEQVSRFHGHPSGVWSVRFSKQGDDTVYSTGTAGHLKHWDATTGKELDSFPAVGNGNVSTSENGFVLVADQRARVASLLDTRPRGEIWATQAASCEFTLSQSLGVAGDHLIFAEECVPSGEDQTLISDVQAVVMSARDGEVLSVVPEGQWQSIKLSPDGSRFVRVDRGEGPVESGLEDWFGPARVRDATTGEILVELQEICTWDINVEGSNGTDQPGCSSFPDTPFPMIAFDLWWSPDGTRVVLVNGITRFIGIWDAHTGELVSGYNECEVMRGGFFDGEELLVYCTEGEEARMVVVDPNTGEETRSIEMERLGSDDLAIAGYTPDGSSLVGIRGILSTGGGALVWFDPSTFEMTSTLPRIHEGAPKSFATSPSGQLLATGSSDGFVKVWDVVERRQVEEIQLGNTEVQGLAFMDEDHLAALTQDGALSVFTLDIEELVDVLSGSITREFTATECERYGFGEECPTLDSLRQTDLTEALEPSTTPGP